MIIRTFIELAALAVFLTAAAIWLPVFVGV